MPSKSPFFRRQQGFTLVELSVVIVIIGLLVMGVMAARTLIRQADLKQVITQIKAVSIAGNQFQSKYYALPGDMRNATTYFTAAYVRNGNGNEMIGQDVPASSVYESSQSLVHLSEADMIPGTYEGDIAYATINLGETKLGIIGQISHFDRINVNTITLARIGTVPHCFWCNGAFTVQEAKTIDSKIDDGVANTGFLYGVDANDAAATNCSARWNVVAGADYNATPPFPDQKVCRLFYYIQTY